MNICFLSYLAMIPYEGGVQRVTTILSSELSKRGHKIVFLCYSAERKHKINNPAIEFPQYYIDMTSGNLEKIGGLFDEFLKEHQIDVIINQTPEAESNKLIRLSKLGVKVVAVSHVVPFAEHKATRRSLLREFPSDNFKLACYKAIALASPKFYIDYSIRKTKAVYSETLQCSDKFVFISERFFSRIKYYMPAFPTEKMAAINNPNTFDVEETIDFESKRNMLLWVGRVDPNKNLIDFVRMWKVFSVNHQDWVAVVAGDGPNLSRIKKWSSKNNLKNIKYLGYCKNIDKYYKEAKILVSTSFNESWGMSLTEAMTYGCIPCVYNTYETLSDIITNGQDGIVCDVSPEVLSKKLEQLSSNELLMASISMQCQKSVKRFSVARICDLWEALLNKIIKSN